MGKTYCDQGIQTGFVTNPMTRDSICDESQFSQTAFVTSNILPDSLCDEYRPF